MALETSESENSSSGSQVVPSGKRTDSGQT